MLSSSEISEMIDLGVIITNVRPEIEWPHISVEMDWLVQRWRTLYERSIEIKNG